MRKTFCLLGPCILLVWGGIMVSASPRYINCSSTTKKVLQMKHPKKVKARGQDSYVDRGVLFKFWSDDVLQMYHFKTGKLLNECSVSGKHCSVASFIPKKNGYGRMFIETNLLPATVYVNEMNGNRPKLSRILKFPGSKYGYNMKHVVDTSGYYIYGIATRTKSRISSDNGNYMIISVWNTRRLSKNSDKSYTPKYVRSFKVPFIMFCQGMCFYRNKLYILSSDYSSPCTKVYAVDLIREQISEVYHQFPKVIKERETQGVFVDGGYLFIDEGTTVYRVSKVY